jgi:DNA repair protein RadC
MTNDTPYDFAAIKSTGRPEARERLAREGVASLSDAELLSTLLGTGTKGRGVRALAEDVLGLLDGAGGPPEPEKLRLLPGMGAAKACAVAAALELGRRLYGHKDRRIASPRDVWPLVAHWADRKQERFVSCSLNGAHEVVAVRVVSVGLVNRTVVHPREVFADPLQDRACAVVVGHNHPSGKLDPSPEDLEITRRLKDAGDILGISLLDHLIFSRDGFFSFVEHGLLEAPSQE